MRVAHRADRPRLSVFRSARHISAQVIDDAAGRTIAAASDRDAKPTAGAAGTSSEGRRVAIARAVGTVIAERARAKGVTKVVFDRSGYAYHGQVRAIADGARDGGLEF